MTTWIANDIGLLPGGNFSIALGCSADGSVIVGVADTGSFDGHAFRWTAGGGMEDLGLLAGGSSSIAYGVSADGTIVVGQGDGGAAVFGNTQAFRWTSGGGMVGLPFLGTGNASVAFGISADGTTIVGYSTLVPGVIFSGAFPDPCKWVGGVASDLGSLSGNPPSDLAQAASSNGSVIVGGNNGGGVPWYWTSGGGTLPLPLFAGQTSGNGEAVSADGTKVTGDSFGPEQAFIATVGGSATLIGVPGGDSFSVGLGMSADGTIIVGGSGAFNTNANAFYWTNAGGFESLPPLGGDAQANAKAISSDGLVPVGSSGSPGSQHAVFWSTAGSPVSTTIAELWFSNTPSFVDLTSVSNRRKFISDIGGAQNLGATGQTPIGTTPPVFLTTQDVPADFAINNGRGGVFSISGGSLSHGDSDPPGTSASVTSGDTAPPGQGILGDYRNGNLYGFNPATYTDNGTRRRWVRRWRGLPHSTTKAVRYSYLVVEMETGIGVPPGANPQVILRWSDDGGHTWSAERFRPAGKGGQTRFTIKYNRMGSTRRFNGSDRIFELSSADPFKVALIDADVETSPPTQ